MNPDGIIIRPATLNDVAELAAVQHAAWLAAYRGLMPDHVLDKLTAAEFEAAWRNKLTQPARRDFVGQWNHRLAGFVSFGPCRDEGAARTAGEILGLYLHPDQWGRGCGKALCDAAMTDMARDGLNPVTLWVLAGNRRACAFYERAGFSPNGRTKTVLRDGAEMAHVQYVKVIEA